MDLQRIAKRVATQHAHGKTAFNKENPNELLSQIVKLLDKATTNAEGKGRQALSDATSRVKGITKLVQDAWDQRNEK